MPETRSQGVILLVVGFIGLLAVGCIGGAVFLSAIHTKVPDQMWSAGVGFGGVLSGMLISVRGTSTAGATTSTTTTTTADPAETTIADPAAPPAVAPGDENLDA